MRNSALDERILRLEPHVHRHPENIHRVFPGLTAQNVDIGRCVNYGCLCVCSKGHHKREKKNE